MHILDFIILGLIAIGILLAIRRMKKKGGCCGCAGNCSHCKKEKDTKS
ncbi:FeoB-associated Cys-rich membrane protein [Anaerotignum sp.]|nr:FeoB-associated Cys-rich membrane protein [Anaerotignum sp.]